MGARDRHVHARRRPAPSWTRQVDDQRAVVHRDDGVTRTGGVSSKPPSSMNPSTVDRAVGPRAERGLARAGRSCSSSVSMPSSPCRAVGVGKLVDAASSAAAGRELRVEVAQRRRRVADVGARSARTAPGRGCRARPAAAAGKISPSWNSSVHWALSVPGNRPPMSMWWAIDPAQAISCGRRGRAA